MTDTNYLYHYYKKNSSPFRTLTSLPFEEAKAIMCEGLTDNETRWVDNFLNLRYERDKLLGVFQNQRTKKEHMPPSVIK